MHALLVLGVVAAAAIVTATGLMVSHQRQREVARAERDMAALSRTLAEQTARAMQSADLILAGVRERLLRDRAAGYLTDERAIHTLLRARMDGVPQVRSLALLDSRGWILASSNAFPVSPARVGDNWPSLGPETVPEGVLHFGEPKRSPVDGRWLLPVCRRLPGAAGGADGRISAAITPEYFVELYRSLGLGPGHTISLYLRNGALVASTDPEFAVPGTPARDPALVAVLGGESPARPGTRLITTTDRFLAIGEVPGLPLVVTVEATAAAVLAEWRAGTALAFWGAGGMIALLGLITFVLAKQLQRGEVLGEALRKFSRAIDQTASTVVITDPQGIVEYVNPRFVETTGYAAEEVIGRRPSLLKSGYTSAAQYGELWRTIHAGGVWQGEFRNRRKDGSLYWESAIISPVRDERGEITHFVAIKDDITERKEALDALHESHQQLREMAAMLNSLREEEMTRIARELHDELGQKLTGMKMDLSWLEGRLPRDQAVLHDKLRSTKKLIDATVSAVRRISTGLRPLVLDDLGPIAAIEWLADDFTKHSGVDVVLDLGMEELEVDERTATAIFRIVQESLTNVARHAAASCVEISLELENGRLALRVSDDGRGMPNGPGGKTAGFGLVGIRERAYMLGGEFHVSSLPGEGTEIAITIPLAASAGGGEGR